MALNEQPGSATCGPYRLVRAYLVDSCGEVFDAECAEGPRTLRRIFVAKNLIHSNVLEVMRSVASLSGPHVVELVDYGFDEQTRAPYLVYGPCAKTTLSNLFVQGRPMAPEAAVRIALHVTLALQEARACGLFHGSLGPRHVTIGYESGESNERVRVRVGGFEVARLRALELLQGPSVALSYIGAEDAIYAAPVSPDGPRSQHDGEREASANDIWAVGAMLYEALSGRLPSAPEPSENGAQCIHIQDLAPWVAPGLARVVMGLLLVGTERRCLSLEEVVRALRPFATGPGALTVSMLKPFTDEGLRAPRIRAELPQKWSDLNTEGDEPSAGSQRMIGTLLAGRYRLLRHIGSGGMGSVYEAETLEGHRIAIKVIRFEVASENPQLMRRFVREARTTMRLSASKPPSACTPEDEHVVRVIDAGRDETLQVPFIAMELLKGRDLDQVLRSSGRIEPAIAARVFADAARGLSKAHDIGLIHRDLRPANIFLHEDEDGRVVVKLCDFGIAKQVKQAPLENTTTELTHAGGVMGSPLYMSPEQSQSAQDIDGRSDIWSLSVSMYRALTGRHPWRDCSSVAKILVAIHTETPPKIEQLAPWVPAGLAAVVHRGLRRRPDERFASAREFQLALEPFAADQGTLRNRQLAELSAETRAKVVEFECGRDSGPASDSTGRSLKPGESGTPTARLEAKISKGPHSSSKEPPRARTSTIGVVLAAAVAACAGLVRLSTSKAVMAVAPDATPAPSVLECRTPGDCGARSSSGESFRCRANGTCARIESSECTVHAEADALNAPNTLWIGTMFPLGGSDANLLGTLYAQAADLARRDFEKLRAQRGTSLRPIGIVSCDDSGDSIAVGRHLAEDAEVHAVIGFRSSKEVIDLTTSLFIPKDVLAIAALNQSSLITAIPHPEGRGRLVYRTATSATEGASAVSAILRDRLEAELRERVLRRDEHLKVGVLRPATPSGLGFADALFSKVRFNEASAFDNGELFRDFPLGSREARSATPADVAQEVAKFAPHVLIYASDGDDVAATVRRIEAAWNNRAFRPTYIVSGSAEPRDLPSIERTAEIHSRFIAVAPPSDQPANLQFTKHYNAAFGAQLNPQVAPASAYDAVYLLAYAARSSNEPKLSGEALSRGIARLTGGGPKLDVGPTAIEEALRLLDAGQHLDLDGASNKFDFDLATGESPSDFVITCLSSTAQVHREARYRADKDQVEGNFECP